MYNNDSQQFRSDTNRNLKTLMLFRCTRRDRAVSFCNGYIYFGSPRQWINIEREGNKGQGDILEGVLYSCKESELPFVQDNIRNNPLVESFVYNDSIFFRRKNVLDLRCLCLYGLHNTVFVKEIDSEGRAHYKSRVTQEYFSCFSEYRCRDDYKLANFNMQPVVILIKNPYDFFNRIINALKKIGVKDNEIIISPVTYTNRQENIIIPDSPYELLFKDECFKTQSEVRIIVNSENPIYLEYMRINDNILSVGSLEDITEINNYYFEDMELELWKNRGMLVSLPESITKDLKEFSFFELLELIYNIRAGSVKISNCNPTEPLKEKLKFIFDLIYEKYKIIVSLDDNDKLQIFNVSNELFENLMIRYSRQIKYSDFEKEVDGLIKCGKAEEAILLCKQYLDDSERVGIAYYCLGKTYLILNNYDEALDYYRKSLAVDYKRIDSLNGIATVLFHQKKYQDAIDTYILIQEEKGYDTKIYVNVGICYIHLKKYRESIAFFDKALEIDRLNADAFFNKGVAYLFLSMHEKAKECYEKAIELDRSNEFYNQEYNRLFTSPAT